MVCFIEDATQRDLHLLIYLIILNIFDGLKQQVLVILYYNPLLVLYICTILSFIAVLADVLSWEPNIQCKYIH